MRKKKAQNKNYFLIIKKMLTMPAIARERGHGRNWTEQWFSTLALYLDP